MEFVTVYDRLNDLKEKYAGDEFGTKYSGLTMKPTFEKMGVEEYTVEVGAKVDDLRMKVVESEYSSEYAKDTVMRLVTLGMELEGNVMRPAECVASLGTEEEIKAAEQAEEVGQEDGAKEE
jgi:molecular chaperone GrpE (heat shock protein)